jgi:hypothetical protein
MPQEPETGASEPEIEQLEFSFQPMIQKDQRDTDQDAADNAPDGAWSFSAHARAGDE